MNGHKPIGRTLILCLCLALLAWPALAQDPETAAPQAAVGSAFTYQGRLQDAAGAVDGACDLRFKLFNAASGGTQIGDTRTLTGVEITDGLFTVPLDFGAGAFNGWPRWLEIWVRCPAGSGSYVQLSPRQSLTPAPYALYALDGPEGSNGGGDITAVSAGTGLSGGGDSGAVTLAADTTYLQRRVTGTCAAGSSIRVVKADGTVTCEPDDTGGSGAHDHWGETWSGTGTGLTLESSDSTGLRVLYAAQQGVFVLDSGQYGVWALTRGQYGGYFRNKKSGGGGLYAEGGGYTSPDIVLGGRSASDDDGRLYSELAFPSSDMILVSNDEVRVHLDENNNESSEFRIYNGADAPVTRVEESGTATFTASGATPDVVLGGLSASDDDGRLYTQQDLPSSDMILVSNGEVRVHLDENNNESSEFRIYNGADAVVARVAESGTATFTANDAHPDVVLGGVSGSDDGRLDSEPDLNSSDILLVSNDEVHVHLDNNDDESSEFRVINGDDIIVFRVTESGAVTFAGAAATAVQAGAHGTRSVYPVQATGNWVEDFGTAQLAAGEATVQIEPVFAQTVNLSEYQVFLTPLGDCPLYVSAKTTASFTVRASGGQRCSIGFDYRIVARQRGYEGQRLERVPQDLLDGGAP